MKTIGTGVAKALCDPVGDRRLADDCTRCLDHLKARHLEDIAHELRTVLTLIRGPLNDLRAEIGGELPPAACGYLDLAAHGAERLQGLVEQILDSAQVGAGRLALEVRRIDLVRLLDDLALSFRCLAARRGLRFRFAPPAEAIPVCADPQQLWKVFANLLSNALRYSPNGGLVEMEIDDRQAAGTVAVTVRDEGPGIAPEDLERIFDRFQRVARPTVRGEGGTGLGLPLARRLAELHGGRLTVDSAVGEGSAFRVELRLGCDHFAPSQVVGNRPWRETAPPPAAATLGAPCAAAPAPGAADPTAADRTTVLVVDDQAEVRTYVCRHLEARYCVAEAEDGAEGYALARDLMPDLVISDVIMPGMDGYQLCRALKRDPELDWMPVILLTARAATGDRLQGLRLGADAYLTKPFDARELLARVDNLIAGRQRLKMSFARGGGARARVRLAPGVRPTPGDRRWLERVRDALDAGLEAENLSVETLAVRLAVHRGRLHQRLRQLTGMAPARLILDWRLKRAATLLLTADAQVSDIAYAAGFQSVSHFSRTFRERFGSTPSAYRRGVAA